ncbi:MAG: L,D-transpeptidase family protein [Cognatishimia sp.]|uniref:L,D-transpeptidase family protein n=1 Tax=Cognatishimia sp. TaxID=2211648 RepID=UPI004059DAED
MRRLILVCIALVALASCGSQFGSYTGPKVTRIVVEKSERKMHLMHGPITLRSYDVGLGFAPVGDKVQEGDGKTPEGVYYVDRRNPQSQFYLSLGISYPNEADIAEAKALGVDPGGDIFIHGRPKKYQSDLIDWTLGCIAVTNREMREIYIMVELGTKIVIKE